MDNVASVASSYFSAVTLVAFILTTPFVRALSPLPTEEHRRVPAITVMATFSPLAITGYTVLAVIISYSLIRLYYFLKPHVLSSAVEPSLPQPVSAGRISYPPFYSRFTFSRSRYKSSREPNSVRNRSFFSIFHRLTRPSSPLHLSGAELLPTTTPNSPSAHVHSLIDLPTISSSGPVSQRCNSPFKPTKQLSKASSMDTLPLYRPLTPVSVPPSGHIALPLPSTPPPPSPTPLASLAGITKTDIQLVPITPQTHRFTPMNSASPNDPSTTSLVDTFPAISLSPSSSTAIPSSINPAGPRPSTSNPSLFLSSRTLSSLSLSPQSLYMQQHKRSKSLGGVAVKKVPPKSNSTALWECENMADSDMSGGYTQPCSLNTEETTKDLRVRESALVSSPTEYPKFHLNFSSSSSSSTSCISRSSESLSPSPLTANSGSALSSAPLRTPRTLSSASHSPDDIAKSSKNEPLLSRQIPLVDADMNMNTDVVIGYGVHEEVSGWRFDAEEPVPVAHILEDFDNVFDSIPSYTTAPLLKSIITSVDLEEIDRNMDEKRIGEEDTWKWDEDVENQMDDWHLDMGGIEESTQLVEREWETSDGTTNFTLFPSEGVIIDDTPEDDPDAVLEGTEYSPEMPHLPGSGETLPPLLSEPVQVPAISICTQDDVLARKDFEFDSGMTSASSIGRATPVSLGQTPTPPASPPREIRATPLPRSLPGQALNDSATTSPVDECHVLTADTEAQEEEAWGYTSDARQQDENTSPTTAMSLVREANEVQEMKKMAPFFDRPLVSSPASLPGELPESDGESEFKFNVEVDADGLGESAVGQMVTGWMYDTDEEQQEPNIDVQFSAFSPDAVDGCNQEKGEARALQELEESFIDESTQSVNKALRNEPIGDSITQVEVKSASLSATSQSTPTSTAETAQEDPVSALVVAAALTSQPNASLPGSLPEATSPLVSKSIPKTTQNNFSPPLPQRRHRTRTSLEEAIARTRSPLEVALAMQLRPGLGLSADPAWMVRFMMVMWGWVFGLSLGFAEA